MNKSETTASRRGLLAAVGLGGGAAVTMAVLPRQTAPLEAKPEVAAKPEKGGGYALTEHVKRYYKTTLV